MQILQVKKKKVGADFLYARTCDSDSLHPHSIWLSRFTGL